MREGEREEGRDGQTDRRTDGPINDQTWRHCQSASLLKQKGHTHFLQGPSLFRNKASLQKIIKILQRRQPIEWPLFSGLPPHRWPAGMIQEGRRHQVKEAYHQGMLKCFPSTASTSLGLSLHMPMFSPLPPPSSSKRLQGILCVFVSNGSNELKVGILWSQCLCPGSLNDERGLWPEMRRKRQYD